MSLKSLLGKKPKTKVSRPKPQMLGKWKMVQGDEVIARVRVIMSMDVEFFKGQRLYQVLDENNSYNNVAFVKNDGTYNMFKTYAGKREEDVLHNFHELLKNDGKVEDVTLVEVHQDATFHDSVLGKALAKWQETDKSITK